MVLFFCPKVLSVNYFVSVIEQNIKYQLIDERKKLTEVNFSFKASLHEYQQKVVHVIDKKEMGILVAPPGSGKTIMGLVL